MRLAGLLLLASGWAIVLAAFLLLGGALARCAFVAAGIATEFFGLTLVAREHAAGREAKR